MSARRIQGGHENGLPIVFVRNPGATFGGDGQVHATARPHRILLASSFFDHDQVGIEQPEHGEPLLNRSFDR
jgi:hypothetical protein